MGAIPTSRTGESLNVTVSPELVETMRCVESPMPPAIELPSLLDEFDITPIDP